MSIFYIILTDPLPESLAVDITEANTFSDDKTISKDKLTFAHLKELILIATKRTSLTVYRRIHEVKSLWKIENLVEGKDRWGELEEIAKEKNGIKQNQNLRDFGGVKLISSNLVRNRFPDYEFPEEHVHIIVTVEPQPPATTGKCLPIVPLEQEIRVISHPIFYFLFDQAKEDWIMIGAKTETEKKAN